VKKDVAVNYCRLASASVRAANNGGVELPPPLLGLPLLLLLLFTDGDDVDDGAGDEVISGNIDDIDDADVGAAEDCGGDITASEEAAGAATPQIAN
jgi:hypothetical protein